MFRSAFLGSVFLVVLLACFPHAAFSQTVAVAQVSGLVTDATGGALANAQVTMTETDKGAIHPNTPPMPAGQYVLPNLPVGPYRLEVKANGFKDYVQTGIIFLVNKNIQVNATMQVGSLTESVEVSATTSLVETKENSISHVIDAQQHQRIAAERPPGYPADPDPRRGLLRRRRRHRQQDVLERDRISVAGGQGNGTAYLLDGGDNTDAMSNVNMPLPFPDALQEFSVETSAVSSRFGTHPGATVNVVTKSGSNDFHGDLFEYIRNGDLNARNFFAPARDTLKRNQFGGTAGGRIIKDKLFFFGGYQGTRNRSNPPVNTTYIPTSAMLTGDFSTITSAACNSSEAP